MLDLSPRLKNSLQSLFAVGHWNELGHGVIEGNYGPWENQNPEFSTIYRSFLQKTTKALLADNVTQVGIEVEVEKINKGYFDFFPNEDWKWELDGSLRGNSAELITVRPFFPTEAAKALSLLWASFCQQPRGVSFSWRTSIHCHLNVRSWTYEKLAKLAMTYLVFEDVLFEFAGPKRKDSVFCVPLNKTNTATALKHFLKVGNVDGFLRAQAKYSALNFLPIKSAGSVEFRQMAGVDDPVKIIQWISLLVNLWSYANSPVPLREVMDRIIKLNTDSQYESFGREVFAQSFQLIENIPEYSTKLSICSRYAKPAICDGPKRNPTKMPFIASPMAEALIKLSARS